ncbi:hypothetical protein AVEN_89463-1 [Araneus ventricosus]|uniref:Uncharacterized protein n=1 Tax=Araneus ventricosus TaxID=182803 RepID=A0A4Y2SV84_ARAVE|nr:hypothetical protein AVEN_89463-1 [Araneus ventricosus]
MDPKKKVSRVIENYLLTLDRKYKRELRGILADHFSYNRQIYLGIYLNVEQLVSPGLALITSCPLSQFSATVFTSLSEENLVPDKCLEPRLGAKSGRRGLAPDFPLELLQQFLSFGSSMGIVMKEDDTITQHAREFASDNCRMTQRLFPFSEFKGTLIWNKVLSRE